MNFPLVHLGGNAELPLLVLGPSLGTSAESLWGPAAARLGEDFHVLGWDLPGHGRHRGTVDAVSVEGLADLLLTALDEVVGPQVAFDYAGDSLGGAVGLQLLLDAPERVRTATLLCTGARIGTPESWADRAAGVRASGTASLVAASAERWFAPGFLDRDPDHGSALLHALAEVDDAGYAACCDALASFDVRDRLGQITRPVLAVAGEHDQPTPPDSLREIADGVAAGRTVVLPHVAHLAPIEAPGDVADLIRAHARGTPVPQDRDRLTVAEVRDAGMAVRREVLGDAHVDRATAATTDLIVDFQRFITEYAWGGIWTRPGLDRRSRSMTTLTALIARGHHAELAMHVRAARRNGLSVDEIKEVILQSAIYCGVPDANTAFKIAQETLAAEGED
ncbi:4-carboxymuconolactone decarboxylase [Nocardioides panacisoli]|uniref:bifunctional 3-oxoadipate enol-lactonase/4-carboxymuconolactone decarboxylase PcaDC n=1 Tax=Nocardioides panacisoli TaxID=627624 RepID=UPI001C62C228|nr:4-carboxymuconolactone decarboxylase [Nocardioides panacisoli]QYJ03563.1 4-carboxymuconolactone decarboxylase [Nocardioides panacisoli]